MNKRKVIAVLNLKGGVGKTTISAHLARLAALLGFSVVLLDTDESQASFDWSTIRPDQTVEVMIVNRPVIHSQINKGMLRDIDYIIVDGAPYTSRIAESALKAADLVLIPVTPGGLDVRTTRRLMDTLYAEMDLRPELKAAFVMNRVEKNTILARELKEELRVFEIPILDTVIYKTQDMARAMTIGSTVFDAVPNEEAQDNFKALFDEVEAYLK